MSVRKALCSKLIFGKYRIKNLIAKGTFGEVYQGINILDKKYYALKIEEAKNEISVLNQEAYILMLLKGPGIPSVFSYGKKDRYNILVENLLGKSIERIWKEKKKKFNLKDICMFSIQALERIEYVHKKNFIHRDIKPGNFLVGNPDTSQIYLIDFGNAKKYKSSRTGKHIQYNKNNYIFGTTIFLSLNVLKGIEQTRKDDLESFGIMIIYLYKGTLPWCHMHCKTIFQTLNKMLELKKNTPFEKLCEDMPQEICEYLKYVNNLSFEQTPDYKYLRSLFLNILANNGMKNDCIFSWCNRNIIPNRIKYNTRNNSLNRIYSNLKLLKTIDRPKNDRNVLTLNITEEELNNKKTIDITQKNKELNDFSEIMKTDNFKNDNTMEIKKIDNEYKHIKKNDDFKIDDYNNFIINKELNKEIKGNKKVIYVKKYNDLELTDLNNNNIIPKKDRIKDLNNKISKTDYFINPMPKPINKNNIKAIKKKDNLKMKNIILGDSLRLNVPNKIRNCFNINNININSNSYNNLTYVTIFKKSNPQELDKAENIKINQIKVKNIKTQREDNFYTGKSQNNSRTGSFYFKPCIYKPIFKSKTNLKEDKNDNKNKLTKKKIIVYDYHSKINRANLLEKSPKEPKLKIISRLRNNINYLSNFINKPHVYRTNLI